MEQNREYEVVLTKQAQKLFKKIKDRREQELLLTKLEKLKHIYRYISIDSFREFILNTFI